jgi:hypothetical protein
MAALASGDLGFDHRVDAAGAASASVEVWPVWAAPGAAAPSWSFILSVSGAGDEMGPDETPLDPPTSPLSDASFGALFDFGLSGAAEGAGLINTPPLEDPRTGASSVTGCHDSSPLKRAYQASPSSWTTRSQLDGSWSDGTC